MRKWRGIIWWVKKKKSGREGREGAVKGEAWSRLLLDRYLKSSRLLVITSPLVDLHRLLPLAFGSGFSKKDSVDIALKNMYERVEHRHPWRLLLP